MLNLLMISIVEKNVTSCKKIKGLVVAVYRLLYARSNVVIRSACICACSYTLRIQVHSLHATLVENKIDIKYHYKNLTLFLNNILPSFRNGTFSHSRSQCVVFCHNCAGRFQLVSSMWFFGTS